MASFQKQKQNDISYDKETLVVVSCTSNEYVYI
jgi:hypothetical protein